MAQQGLDATPPPTRNTYYEERPWGSFTVLDDQPHYKAKRLVIHPGHRLSLQRHEKREEHWIVSRGAPTITLNDRVWVAAVGEYIHIPQGAVHRIANVGPNDTEIVEVQLGSYFGEDDIIRLEDDYKRP